MKCPKCKTDNQEDQDFCGKCGAKLLLDEDIAAFSIGTACHLLRHTFGFRMAAVGVPIPVLKEIMGHKDIKTTMIYTRVSPDVWYDEIRKA